jgi:hypothetical protein
MRWSCACPITEWRYAAEQQLNYSIMLVTACKYLHMGAHACSLSLLRNAPSYVSKQFDALDEMLARNF